MDYGKTLGDSFEYTKDGLLGNISTWILLLVLALLPAIPLIVVMFAFILTQFGGGDFAGGPGMMGAVPDWTVLAVWCGIALFLAVILSAFYSGYTLKILRGEAPLPPVAGFMNMFTDGIQYIVIQIVYMIPVLIVFCVTVVPTLLSLFSAAIAGGEIPAEPELWLGMLSGILLTLVVAFICGLVAIAGLVRFARKGTIGEAFNISAILATIGKIGYGTYILALIIMILVVIVVNIVLEIIPFVGGFLQVLATPWIGVFSMRYVSLLFDSAGAE